MSFIKAFLVGYTCKINSFGIDMAV